eukprot:gene13753-16254_t
MSYCKPECCASSKPSLDDVLSIYTESFFYPDHEAFLQKQFESKTDRKITLTHLTTDCKDKDLYISHLRHRVPVYFGESMVATHYDDKKFERVMNRSTAECENMWAMQKEELLYAIIAEAQLMSGLGSVIIVHTWGVNFEHTGSADYKRYLPHGRFDSTSGLIYTRRYESIFYLILISIFERCKGDARDVKVRCPFIGMGAYLKALNSKSRYTAYSWFVRAVRTVFSSCRAIIEQMPNFQFVFCEMDSEHPLIENLKAQYIPNVSVKNENLMNISPSDGTIEFVVNAWDSNSFIGNGGCTDTTVDGFIVANAGRRNNAFRNDSYLHNSFFATEINFRSLSIPVPYDKCDYAYTSPNGERWFILLTEKTNLEVRADDRKPTEQTTITVESPFCQGSGLKVCNKTPGFRTWKSRHTAERNDRAWELTESQYLLLWFLIGIKTTSATAIKDAGGQKWAARIHKMGQI